MKLSSADASCRPNPNSLPAIGLALVAGAALPAAPRLAAAAWLLLYSACSIGFLQPGLQRHWERGESARRLLAGLAEIRRTHPGKTVLLTGITDQLFYGAIYDEALRILGLRDVYLAPSHQQITQQPELLPIEKHQLPARATLAALRENRAVVYEAAGGRLHNITNRYRLLAEAILRPAPPRRVDLSQPHMAEQLGSGWHGLQRDHRWMGQRAELRLAGPRFAGERLRLRAIYPEHLDIGAVQLTVAVNGIRIGRVEIRDRRSSERVFPLPASLVGSPEITVTLETDRTFRLSRDPRQLGLAFGVIELVSP